MSAALDTALSDAHAAADGRTLVGLYAQAADMVAAPADAFFLTQAWIFALECGDPRADGIERTLRAQGRA